MHIPIRYIMLL